MNRALKFRWRLVEAAIVIGLVLFGAFYLAYHTASQSARLEQWVAHTDETLLTIGYARLDRSRLENQTWAWLAIRHPALQSIFREDLGQLQKDMNNLQKLTADNPVQQKIIIEQLTPALNLHIATLKGIMEQQPSAFSSQPSTPGSADIVPAVPAIRGIFDQLEANERELLAQRTAAVRANTKRAHLLIFAAGAITFAIFGISFYLLQRDVMTRAKIEKGLRQVADLLGARNEEQRVKLDYTLDDLHAEIVRRQLAEEDIRRLNEDLEQRVSQSTAELREANNELEAFSYSVSHDLRAPLRHMDGFSRILQQEYAALLPEQANHYLNRVRSATTHMAELVEDLLQLSRVGRQTLQRKSVSLRELVEAAKEEVAQETTGREINWYIHSLESVDGDPGLLHQVFVNLISNAIKFTRLQPRPVIEVGSREKEGEVVIFVRDNGVGFDSKYADKLFGVFQRLHRQDEFEGTGIGLATIQRIVHKHGGRVWAESKLGDGATFYFTLPKHADTSPSDSKMIGAFV